MEVWPFLSSSTHFTIEVMLNLCILNTTWKHLVDDLDKWFKYWYMLSILLKIQKLMKAWCSRDIKFFITSY